MNCATNKLPGRSNNSSGVPICSTMPSCITTMRSAMVIASIWSCVTYTVVVLRRWCKALISARIATRNLASRLERGSSNKNTLGSRTMARPIATRWRCPPESSRGKRSSNLSRFKMRAALATRSCVVCASALRKRKENAMFSRTVMCGYSA